jgi:guanylate kinase
MLVVITGPSACGKTRLCSQLINVLPESVWLPKVTSRPPREDDVPGEYIFVPKAEFTRMGPYFFRTRKYGYYYGLRVIDVDRFRADSTLGIVVIDAIGAIRIMRRETSWIFVVGVLPPSMDECIQVIHRRSLTHEEMSERLDALNREIIATHRAELVVSGNDGATVGLVRDAILGRRANSFAS